MKEYILKFNENIEGLRDFVELIKPILENHEIDSFFKVPSLAIPIVKEIISTEEYNLKKLLPNDQLKKMLGVKEDEDVNKAISEFIDNSEEISHSIDSMGKEMDIKIKKDGGLLKLSVEGLLNPISRKKVMSFKQSHGKKELLYRSSFITLFSTVEWFFAQILHYQYKKHPDNAGVKNKSLTLDDLKSFQSIRDAENFLIERKIESILRSSFTNWMDILTKDFGFSLGYLKDYKSQIIEFYQRRNVIVHNGGIVNSIYLSKVDKELTKKLSSGDSLDIDFPYLESAIQHLHLLFTLIALDLWKREKPSDVDRALVIRDLSYTSLLNQRWEVAKGFNKFLEKDNLMSESSKTIAKLNFWMCIKKLKGIESIKKEINKLDYSDKSVFLKLLLAGLKEDKEEFFFLLPKAIKSEVLSFVQLHEYPIFDEMKSFEEFDVYQQQIDSILFKSDKLIADANK